MAKSKTAIKSKLPIPHYVCMGCRLVSVEKIKCSTQGCPRHRNPLGECRCKNGKHTKIPKLGPSGYPTK